MWEKRGRKEKRWTGGSSTANKKKKKKSVTMQRGDDPSLHDGSVNGGLDVVPSVSRVHHPLSFGVLLDVVLCKELVAHV